MVRERVVSSVARFLYAFTRRNHRFNEMRQLQLFRSPKYEEQLLPPLFGTFLSLLFLAGLAVIVVLYSTETLRCSMVPNQIGCQTMTSAADCDNLVTATCTTKCSQTPYTYCSDWQQTTMMYGWPTPCQFSSTTYYALNGQGTTTPIENPASKTWSTLTPPADSTTCKAFFSQWISATSIQPKQSSYSSFSRLRDFFGRLTC